MAQKAVLNVSNYSGGLNNHTNGRDIEMNQYQDIDSLSIETPGKLKVMGATAEEGTTLTITDSTFTPVVGNGLFYFKSDKDPEQTNIATDNTEMILVNDRADHDIKIYDKTDSAYSAKTIDYGPAASDVEFTAIDGDVRVTATDFSSDTTTPKVFTFINEKFDYGNTSTSNGIPRLDKTGWYEDTAIVDKPSDTEIELIHRNDSNTTLIPTYADSGATLSGAISGTGAITPTVSNGNKFTAGGYIQIGTEIMHITSISSNTLTINAGDRGRFGTTAATHSDGATINYVNRTPINQEVIRVPYGAVTHSNNTGKLVVNFWAGTENRSNGTIPNDTGDALSGTWFNSAYDKVNLFVQFEYLDGQLSEVEYKSTMQSPESLGAAAKYKLYWSMFGHIPNKTRLKSMHILYNVTNDGYIGISSDATSYMTAMQGVKYKLLEIDLRKGWRVPGAEEYQSLHGVTAPSTAAQKFYAWPMNLTTVGTSDAGYHIQYGGLNYGQGYEDPITTEIALEVEPSILGQTGTSYKTATFLNRRLYVGNVKYKDPVTGEFMKANDTVFKSDVNAFDTFTFDNRIEVEINDGDDIIKLENLNGRLLQFKKNNLFVINVSRGAEFLEATLEFRGVEKDYHVCKGEGFVAWFNRYGVFIYDGQQVRDLLLDQKGQKRLDDWQTNYYNINSVIGYMPETREIIIVNKNQKDLLFDMKAMAWSFGSKRFTTNNNTNFINLDNGKLCWMEKVSSALKLRYFNPAPSNLVGSTDTDEIALKTKDFTFNNPSINKKIISVYMNYKNGDGVTLYGFTDGAEEILARLDGENETDFKTLRVNIRNARTEFSDESVFNNVKNFGLRLSGTGVASNFEINDMQIVFREKSVK